MSKYFVCFQWVSQHGVIVENDEINYPSITDILDIRIIEKELVSNKGGGCVTILSWQKLEPKEEEENE